jgi:uncharacterized protein
MLEVMMALGRYRFGLSTAAYDSLERTAQWRWPTQDVLGAHPVRQYVGPGSQTIVLSGKVLPHYKGLLGLPNLLSRIPQITRVRGALANARSALTRVGVSIPGLDTTGSWTLDDLRQDADSGRPLMLVDGRGRNWGYWVVTFLREIESSHLADGSALSVRFAVELSYYGDEAPDAVTADTSITGAVRGILGI